jgi:hypothetical protein
MHLKESRDQKLLLWAYTHVVGMLCEQNRGIAGVGRGTLIFFPTWLYWQRNPENRAYNICTGPPQVADLSRAASSTELF